VLGFRSVPQLWSQAEQRSEILWLTVLSRALALAVAKEVQPKVALITRHFGGKGDSFELLVCTI